MLFKIFLEFNIVYSLLLLLLFEMIIIFIAISIWIDKKWVYHDKSEHQKGV